MKNTLKELWNWIKDPDQIEFQVTTLEKFSLLFRVLLIELLVAIPFILFTIAINEYILNLEMILDDSGIGFLLSAVVILAPVLEEFIFRFPLKYKRNYLARMIDYMTNNWLRNRWTNFFKYFVYFLAIGFGLVHISNYENQETLFYILTPVIIGTQLIGGLTLSFTRVKLGFLWGILQHGLYNLSLITLGLLFSHNASMIQESDDQYTISINELMYINTDSTRFNKSIINDTVYYIEANDYNLQAVLDSIKLDDIKVYDNTWADFRFESKSGVHYQEVYDIIEKEIRFKE